MKTRLFFILTLLILSSLAIFPVYAQYPAHTQLSLPEGAKARLGKGQIVGKNGYIVYSPDSKRIAVESAIGIWIYEVDSGQEFALLAGVWGISTVFSPDSQTVASANEHETVVRLWNVATAKQEHILAEHTDGILNVAFSPDGQTLASAGKDRTIRLWDVRTGALVHTLIGHTDGVISVAFSPNGNTLASGSGDDTVRLWNTGTGEYLRTLTGHTDAVSSVAFSPDGRTLASSGWDNTVRLWNVETGTQQQMQVIEHRSFESIMFSPDGLTLTIDSWFDIFVWNLTTDDLVQSNFTGQLKQHLLLSDNARGLKNIVLSPDGETLVTWIRGKDSTISLWDSATGEQKHTFTGHTGEYRGTESVVFSPDGKTLASGGWFPLQLWDVETATRKNQQFQTTLHSSSIVLSLSLSPDGQTLVGAGKGRIRFWDVETGTLNNIVSGSDFRLSISYSPDGKTLATAGPNNNVDVWDAETGVHKQTLIGHANGMVSVAFSPDGNTLASGSRAATVHLWDVSTGASLRTLEHTGGPVYGLVFSPEGETLASAGFDKTIRFWNAETGELRLVLKGPEPFYSVAFSPDGQTLAAGGRTGDVLLWNAETGTHTHTLSGHTGWVHSVAFSPDSQTLASGGDDAIVMLWDLTPAPPEPERLAEDINADGTVNIQDLVQVAAQLGATGENPADVNGDGVVNIQDLVQVAAQLGTGDSAPSAWGYTLKNAPTGAEVEQWLTQAQALNLTDATSQRGIRFLEQLLLALTPKETALLPNYPNPFNPETWIPYQLAKPADVTLRIHAVDGSLVRTLSLGHKTGGIYQNRSRAAYWDGKNALGEPVASGVYFYTLTAGDDFTATRKMFIRK